MTKRNRSESSPEDLGTPKKQQIDWKAATTRKAMMGEQGDVLLQMRKMFEDFERKIDGKLSLLASKQDLQQYREEISEVKQQNKDLKKIIHRLEKNREKDKQQLDRLDSALRSKNLIIKGIKDVANTNDGVRKLLADILQVNVEPERTWKMYQSGGKATVRVEFKSDQDVQEVLRNTKKLKGTKIGVDRDLSETARIKRSELLKVRKLIMAKTAGIKPENRKRIVVTGDKLKIDNAVFRMEGGVLSCDAEDGLDKLSEIFNLDFTDLYVEINKFNKVVGNQ